MMPIRSELLRVYLILSWCWQHISAFVLQVLFFYGVLSESDAQPSNEAMRRTATRKDEDGRMTDEKKQGAIADLVLARR